MVIPSFGPDTPTFTDMMKKGNEAPATSKDYLLTCRQHGVPAQSLMPSHGLLPKTNPIHLTRTSYLLNARSRQARIYQTMKDFHHWLRAKSVILIHIPPRRPLLWVWHLCLHQDNQEREWNPDNIQRLPTTSLAGNTGFQPTSSDYVKASTSINSSINL